MLPRLLVPVFVVALAALSFGCAPQIGDECETSVDCSQGGERLCDITQPGGYCTVFNCEPNSCPEDESLCVQFGAVRSPGNFQFPKETTSLDIADLITRLGGFTPTAKSDAVSVIRRKPDGKEEVTTVDVERMISGRRRGDSSRRDFAVYPGDRIWVPERLF